MINYFLSNPATILLVVGQLIVLWSILISHFGSDRRFRIASIVLAAPIVVISVFVGMYKIQLDDMSQSEQVKTLDTLRDQETELADNLRNLSEKYAEQISLISSLQQRELSLGGSLESLIANIKSISEYTDSTSKDLSQLMNIAIQNIAMTRQNSKDIMEQIKRANEDLLKIRKDQTAQRQESGKQIEQTQKDLAKTMQMLSAPPMYVPELQTYQVIIPKSPHHVLTPETSSSLTDSGH